jgi:hypothetical protein
LTTQALGGAQAEFAVGATGLALLWFNVEEVSIQVAFLDTGFNTIYYFSNGVGFAFGASSSVSTYCTGAKPNRTNLLWLNSVVSLFIFGTGAQLIAADAVGITGETIFANEEETFRT